MLVTILIELTLAVTVAASPLTAHPVARTTAATANPTSSLCTDKDNDLCLNNTQNVVLGVVSSISKTQLKKQIQEECKKKPKCPAGQTWIEKDKKCKSPCLPKESAQKCKDKGGSPICAKTPKEYCNYGECSPGMLALSFAIFFAAATVYDQDEAVGVLGNDPVASLQLLKTGLEQAIAHADFLESPTVTTIQALAIYLRGIHVIN
ncbi:hypothetical protein HYQ44_020425 [Verticillium longisporum]|nr:hypothetical protein HYQ44_020425 [Verticillium longisporum]